MWCSCNNSKTLQCVTYILSFHEDDIIQNHDMRSLRWLSAAVSFNARSFFCETQWPRPPLFSPSWLIQWNMGEGSYIILLSPSDVTAFHRIGIDSLFNANILPTLVQLPTGHAILLRRWINVGRNNAVCIVGRAVAWSARRLSSGRYMQIDNQGQKLDDLADSTRALGAYNLW